MNNHTEIEILLVEDSPQDVELTMLALRRGNLANHIVVARDGEEALDILFCRGQYSSRSFSNPPRFIMLDIKLPKVDGLEVLRQLKADPRTKSIPVVIMTSSSEQRDLVQGYQLGLNSFIQKPVDFQEFRDIVGKMGFYWLVINKPPPREAFTEKLG